MASAKRRLQVLKDQIATPFEIPHDTSLAEYMQRGQQFKLDDFRNIYYAYGLEHYTSFYSQFASLPSLNHDPLFEASRPQKRELVTQMVYELKPVFQFSRELNKLDPIKGPIFGKIMYSFDQALCTRLGVHGTLYIDSLLTLGTEKHHDLIDRAYKLQDIGCFALTELAHGSNASGIQTRADYLHETQEFVLNTPTPLDAKWWIGAASQTANKAVVFTRLFIKESFKGIGVLVVDLRDYATHQPMPGVFIGDCGPKLEMDGVDNGFIIFRDYKVPYHALLDKHMWVTPEGKLKSKVKNKNKRLGIMLASLIRGRLSMLAASEALLKNALTIAIRFTAVRNVSLAERGFI